MFISEVIYSIPYIINPTIQKLKLCFILKKGQYLKDNIFLSFIKPFIMEDKCFLMKKKWRFYY